MKKLLFILAIAGLTLTVSCTPESIASDEQQIEKDEQQELPNG